MPANLRELVCPGCDYDLSGSFRGRTVVCPECGRTVGKAEARHVVRRRAAARARLAACLLAISLLLMVLLYVLVGRPQDVPGAHLLWFLAWSPGAAAGAIFAYNERRAFGAFWWVFAVFVAIVWAVASTFVAALALLLVDAARM